MLGSHVFITSLVCMALGIKLRALCMLESALMIYHVPSPQGTISVAAMIAVG